MVFRIRWEFFCNKFGTKGGDLLWHILLVRMSDIAFLFKYLTNEFRRRFIFFFQYTDILTQSLHHSSVVLDNIQKRLRMIVKIAGAWKPFNIIGAHFPHFKRWNYFYDALWMFVLHERSADGLVMSQSEWECYKREAGARFIAYWLD